MALDEWTDDETNDDAADNDGTARAGVVALDRAGSIIMLWWKSRAVADEDDETDACKDEMGCGDDRTLRTGVRDDDDTDNNADDDDDDEAAAWRTE